MRHCTQVKQEAVNLRRTQGLSLNELAEVLGVSKTTIFYWEKDIEMPRGISSDMKVKRAERSKDNQRAATAAMQAKYAALRQDAYDAAHRAAPQLLLDQDI